MKKITILLVLVLCAANTFAQVVAFPPDPIILCDVNNPGDEMEVFDMTIREPQIIGGQTNVVVSYHPTSGDALGNGAVIPNPTNFTNEFNPHIIFIRVENVNNGNDWEVTTLELIVPLIPEVVEQPDDLVIAESNSDGFAEFDLTVNENQALGSQDPFLFQFSYFETQADADSNLNAMANPETYTNIVNPQTIYVRMAPLQDICDYKTYSFTINVEEALSVETNKLNMVEIFPNPVGNELTIEFPTLENSLEITLYDILGQRILSTSSNATADGISLNLSDFTSGVYLLNISDGNVSITRRLVKN